MSTSYIPKNTFAVCTFQLGSKPQKFIDSRKEVSVFHKNKDTPLLTVQDKNLEIEFTCKSPVNAMASFLAFGAGIVAFALLASNPVGWIVLGCAAVALVAGAVYVAKVINHKCTNPMKGGEWLLFHPSVKFNGYNAITQVSMLKCGNGGVLKAFFSYSLACEAAENISNNNKKELATNTLASLVAGFLFPEAVAGITTFKAGAFFFGGTIVGIGAIFGLTYGERSLLRRDSDLQNNQIYKDLNTKVDENELLPDFKDNNLYNPGILSNVQDLQNFAIATQAGGAVISDSQTQAQLNEIANMSKQELFRNPTAKILLEKLNNGELSHLKDAMTKFNSRRMNPTMTQEAIEANMKAFKNNLARMGNKAGQGLLFFVPIVATYFTEKARKAFAESAVKDMTNGINVVTQKPLGK